MICMFACSRVELLKLLASLPHQCCFFLPLVLLPRFCPFFLLLMLFLDDCCVICGCKCVLMQVGASEGNWAVASMIAGGVVGTDAGAETMMRTALDQPVVMVASSGEACDWYGTWFRPRTLRDCDWHPFVMESHSPTFV